MRTCRLDYVAYIFLFHSLFSFNVLSSLCTYSFDVAYSKTTSLVEIAPAIMVANGRMSLTHTTCTLLPLHALSSRATDHIIS